MRPPLVPVAPSIDDPMALLGACHEKVRHFAMLAVRLKAHLEGLAGAPSLPSSLALPPAPDEQARDAARAVLRYFDMAAPLHHEDEELDLFPALTRLGRPEVNAHIQALQAEHKRLAGLWSGIRPWLQDIAEGRPHAAPHSVQAFADGYIGHVRREDEDVYPAAAALAEDELARICVAMVGRRTVAR